MRNRFRETLGLSAIVTSAFVVLSGFLFAIFTPNGYNSQAGMTTWEMFGVMAIAMMAFGVLAAVVVPVVDFVMDKVIKSDAMP